MARKKKTKTSEVESPEVISPVESTETVSSERRKKLDVHAVSVVPAKLPPNKRLFPAALLEELDQIKERLDKLEKTIQSKSE
jgi:hypothetical protein